MSIRDIIDGHLVASGFCSANQIGKRLRDRKDIQIADLGQAGKSGQLAALIQERIRHIYRRQRRLDQAETRPEMLGRRCPDNQAAKAKVQQRG